MEIEEALAVASGIVLGLLGLALLSARPQRAGGRIFGGFLVLWAASILLFNSVRFVDDHATIVLLARLGLACTIPQTLFLVHVASVFPRPRPGWPWASLAAGLLTVVAGGMLAVRPDLFVSGVVSLPAGDLPRYGVAAFALASAPSFLAFFVGTVVLLARYLREGNDLARREMGLVLSAFAAVGGYTAAFQLVLTVLQWDGLATLFPRAAWLYAALFGAGVASTLAVAVVLLARVRRGTLPQRASADARIAYSSLAAVALGLAAWVPVAAGAEPLELLGLVRIAAAAVVLYGILKHQLFGLDLAVKRAIRAGFPVAVAAACEFAIVLAIPFVWPGDPTVVNAVGAAAAVVVGIGFAPLRRRAADRLLPAVVEGDEAYVHGRALEVYRAALDEGGNEPRLAELRRRLRITPEEDRALRALRRVATALPAAAPQEARYRRTRLLGQGGSGRAWLARDRVLGRDVVLKEMPGVPSEQVLLEARVGEEVDSPHVVRVLDAVEQEGRAWIVLEYVDGGSLEERLAREGRLARDEALAIVADVLRGLAAIHAAGLVHRDVKPGNILLGADGRARVADLGLAARPVPLRDLAATRPGGLEAGTILYMSPEQATGRGYDARSDLYAVGAVLYRVLSGRFYVDFGDAGDFHARRLIAEETPRLPLRDLPAAVNAILERGLAKDPQARFADAGQMLAAVEQATARGT